MQSLTQLCLHRSYLIGTICSIKDKDAISIAAAVGVASVIFDCDYL
jgi:hypothetical protein